MPTNTVEVAGRKAAFLEAGAGDPVLYLHGFPTSSYLWRQVMVQTSQEFRALACDFPGFGDSELLGEPHTWENLTAWLDEFVGALGLERVHLGVHDWGGLIGLAWACQHPHKVSSLLITNTSFRAKDRWHAAAQEWRKPGVGEEFLSSLTIEGFKNLISVMGQIPDDAVDAYFKGLSTPERTAAKLEMYRSLEFEMLAPLERKLPEVAPGRVLVAWGAQDPFLPVKLALRFGQKLGAEVVVFEDAGHFLQEARGDDLGRRHREFLLGL